MAWVLTGRKVCTDVDFGRPQRVAGVYGDLYKHMILVTLVTR